MDLGYLSMTRFADMSPTRERKLEMLNPNEVQVRKRSPVTHFGSQKRPEIFPVKEENKTTPA
jgi:hypothetical protein